MTHGKIELGASLFAINPDSEEPAMEQCPTCGVTDPDKDCRYRYEDVGCDHPQRLREVAEAFPELVVRDKP